MAEIKTNSMIAEYKVNNTVYRVRSVFSEATKSERLEDKIQRLILNDSSTKPPAA